MTHYCRYWTCKACEKRQETMDYPDFEICENCFRRNSRVKHHMKMITFHTAKVKEARKEFAGQFE